LRRAEQAIALGLPDFPGTSGSPDPPPVTGAEVFHLCHSHTPAGGNAKAMQGMEKAAFIDFVHRSLRETSFHQLQRPSNDD